MLDLRSKPQATARVPVGGEFRKVTGLVVGQTFEASPEIDIRLDDGAVVRVKLAEAEIGR